MDQDAMMNSKNASENKNVSVTESSSKFVNTETPPEQKEARATRRTRATRIHDNDSNSFTQLGRNEDPIDAGAALLLARIDEKSYEKAVLDDADRIMQKYLLPKSLPWSKPRVPLLRTLPRDIEDMPGIWHAGAEEDMSRVDTNCGRFGFGMFDMGGLRTEDVKGTRADTIISARVSPPSPIARAPPISPRKRRQHKGRNKEDCSGDEDESGNIPTYNVDKFEAAARRSSDRGIVELRVKLPVPTIESALLSCQQRNILPRDPSFGHNKESIMHAKRVLQAERAETCSSMPLYWQKVDKNNFSEPPAFADLSSDDSSESDDDAVGHQNKRLTFHKRMRIHKKRKRKFESLSAASTRTWKVSVKVAGVSSRASISCPEKKPMYTIASFPTYVQSGQSLTFESAQLKDEKEGLRKFLGSYDCRATAANRAMSFAAMDDPEVKNKEGNRSKRINVGRTRLIWARASLGSTKVTYTSLLGGQKLDSGGYKRPKEVKVTVRLNSRTLPAESNSNSEKDANYDTKQKRSSGNIFTGKTKWSAAKVTEAINFVCKDAVQNENMLIDSNHDNQAEILDVKDSICMFEKEDYTKNLIKKIKGRYPIEKKASVNTDVNTDVKVTVKSWKDDLQFIEPTFMCLPLEDGYLRAACVKPGSMVSSSIGKLLAPKEESSAEANRSHVCTVCWTGSETYQVLKCINCSLTVHQDCCFDPGEFATDAASNLIWTCPMCSSFSSEFNASPPNHSGAILPNGGSRKSQRTHRLPNRYKVKSDDNVIDWNQMKKNFKTNYKCTLCPHYGGAMSRVNSESSLWTHEVCRVWCSGREEITGESNSQPKYPPDIIPGTSSIHDPDPVCCLCGMGHVHNKGHENQAIVEINSVEEGVSRIPGLIKCAASGCAITFHPMCAMLASKLQSRGTPPPGNLDPLEQDKELCQQYTFELAEVNQKEGLTGKDTGFEKSYTLPIAFCGLHNPKRDPSFYGCPPCAEQIKDVISIPYQSSLPKN